MFRSNRWRIPVVVVATVFITLIVHAAVATTTTVRGSSITAVKMLGHQDQNFGGSFPDWTDLPSASTTITVPSGQRAAILTTFAGESACEGAHTNDTPSTDIMSCIPSVLVN